MVAPETEVVFSKNSKTRTISAIFMLPMPIIAIWDGAWIFGAFLLLFAFLLMTEWNRLIGLGSLNTLNFLGSFLTVTAIGVMWPLNYQVGFAVLLIAVFANLVVGYRKHCSLSLAILGPIYVFLPCFSLIWIREIAVYGLEVALWLFLVVCTTDTCAYLFGGAIKGPKLAPKVSPGKTWSGLITGILSAGFVGATTSSYWFHLDLLAGNWEWGVIALMIAVSAQLGDLGESWLKRKMNVKDSGKLIPGHGGLLDRADGFVTSVPIMAVGILVCGLD
jgi:phosphatidate cytidylyltransferase